MDYAEMSLKKHYEWKGKIEVNCRVPLETAEDLSLCYTPGVAKACIEIQNKSEKSFELTRRFNTVAVITDGTAVLGLGDIGPEAGMPVMEGKCALFKKFGNVDAIPISIDSKYTDEIVKTITLISKSFGGINLEDIAAPRCFEIEKQLKEKLDIPVFHDDQHGTAIVTLAALINALKLVKKDKENVKIVINGAGAAGIAIAKLLIAFGVKSIIICDSHGCIYKGRENLNEAKKDIAEETNYSCTKGNLSEAMKGSDVFIGVSAPECVTKEMVKSMSENAIVFTMANPTPEIMPEDAKEAGAKIIGTGRSDYPNQINNVLVFPGLFRGILDKRTKEITTEMQLAAANAISECIPYEELRTDYIIPDVLDKRVAKSVAKAIKNI